MTLGGDFTFTGTQALNLGTGAKAMSASRIVTTNSATNALTLGGIISGATFRLTKAGTGMLTLSGANTFTGGVTLNAGILNINNASALGTVAGTFIINGGTIDNSTAGAITTVNYPMTLGGDFTFTGTQALNLGTGAKAMSAARIVTTNSATNALTLGGIISGATFRLTKAGIGMLTLSGANTFTGGVTLNAGILNINNASALGSVAGTFIINGGTIDNSTAGTITTVNYPITLGGDFTFTGTRALSLGTGATSMSASRIITTSSAANALTLGGIISGVGFSLTKAGVGMLTLSGANTFTGGVTLNAGILNINNASALGTVAGTFVINGGTINNSTAGAITTLDYPITLAANFTFTGTRALNLGAGATTMTAARTITANSATNALTLGGVISGATFRLTKAGAGMLTLSGANTYSGGTTLTLGILNINNAQALGTVSANLFIITAGTIDNTTGAPITTLNYPISVQGNFTFTGTRALNLGTGAVALTAARTITCSSATNALTIGGVISGATFRLTKAGAGMLTLTGTNTYSGGTTLTLGILNINNAQALGTVSANLFIISAGTIDNTSGGAITTLNYPISVQGNFTFTGTNALNLGTGAFDLTAARTITCSSASNALTIGGVISGATFRLTKAGAGILTLTGTNTYSGGTTLTAGILNINNAQALGDLSANPFIITTGTINNTSGAAIVTLDYPMTWDGNFTFTGTNDLDLGIGATAMSADIIVTGSANTLKVGGVISGAFRLTKAGAGILTLSGTNTYSGGTTLTLGTLNINNAQALGALSANPFIITTGTINNTSGAAIVTLDYPMTWDGNFTFTGTNDLDLGAGLTSISAARTITVSANTLKVGGVISGAFRLIKDGAGVLTLSGANTYSGGTTLTTGTLNINHASALGTVSANTFIIAAGTTIDNTSGAAITLSNYPMTWNGDFTFTGANNLELGTGAVTMSASIQITCSTIAKELKVCNVISGVGFRLTKAGVGTLTLCGLNLFTGGTTLANGVLNINNIQALGALSANPFIITGGSFDNTSGAPITTLNYPQTWSGDYIFVGTNELNFGTGAIALTTDLIVTVSSAGTPITYCNIISGPHGIDKAGDGTLTLCGANTFTGSVNHTDGIININHAQALGNATNVLTIASGAVVNNTSGAPITILNNNPIQIDGDFTFTGTDDLNLGTGVVTLNSSVIITTSTAGKTLTIGGVINDNTKNITKAGSGNLDFGSQAITLFALRVTTGTVKSTSGTLNLAGNFTNDDTFTHNSGTVKFNGLAAQTISGASTTTFNKLQLDNTTGLTLNTAAIVDNELILTDGIITASQLITLNNGAISNVGSATSYVIGTMRKFGNQNFTFPIGKSTFWAPIGVSDFTAGDATTAFEASYNNAGVTGYQPKASGLTKVSFREQWNLHHAAGLAPTVKVTLHWKDSVRSAIHPKGSATSANIVLAHWNGSEWESIGQSAISMGLVGFITSNPMSSFSPVAPGSTAGSPEDIGLPVELVNFKVIQDKDKNLIKWETASEINNDYFEIEKSKDGVNFEVLINIKGKGNYSNLSNYSAEDFSPFSNQTYYRLKQVDFDGTVSYSNIIVVNSEVDSENKISVFPNPMNENQNLAITFSDLKDNSEILVIVRDITGKEFYSKVKIINQEENVVFSIDLEQRLTPGIYIITGSVDNSLFNKKLIVQ